MTEWVFVITILGLLIWLLDVTSFRLERPALYHLDHPVKILPDPEEKKE
jgi:hypothetical protein